MQEKLLHCGLVDMVPTIRNNRYRVFMITIKVTDTNINTDWEPERESQTITVSGDYLHQYTRAVFNIIW